MPENEKLDFPKISANNWWQLREKFKQSIPSSVTPSYLSTALGGMTELSARKNLLGPLKKLEIINSEGKPTELAKQWRDDETYSKYCETIRNNVYPQELIDAQPPPNPNRESVERWFSHKTGVGSGAAKMLAATYILLCEATPVERDQVKQSKGRTIVKSAHKETPKPRGADTRKEEIIPAGKREFSADSKIQGVVPSIHIDIQIHISPESSAEQIDQIFSSMAKHLGGMSNRNNE